MGHRPRQAAPATVLARCLDLRGVKELFTQRVKRLVIVDAGEPHQDPAALRKVVTEWPTPGDPVRQGGRCGADVSRRGSRTSFAWTGAHPVVDAYWAFKAMPYDTPCFDLAAVHYAGQPDAGFFQASEPGTLSVSDSGQLTFAAGSGGTAVSLRLDPGRRAEVLQALVDISSTKPVAPTRGGPPTA